MYVQPFDGSVSPNALGTPSGNPESAGTLFPGGPVPPPGDNISRFVPPSLNEGGSPMPYGDYGSSGYLQGLFGPLIGVLQQLMQMLQSLMGYGCTSPYGYGSGCPSYGSERFFRNATGSSDGDPHLSFNGAKWNNMTSQPDLLNSGSIQGGFRISTQVTPPDAKGVTWNQSAAVTLNGGATTVTMNDNGEASIGSYGQSLSIAQGQTIELANGASVTYGQNGSLQITAQNGNGGRIDTTLTPEGRGVNVEVSAHAVDLGGTLVNGPPPPIPAPYPPSSEP